MTYPNLSDKYFEDKMSRKLEFREVSGMKVLYPHQERVRRYLSPYTPYECLYLYHATGTGKTFICLSIMEDHYNVLGMRALVILRGDTAENSFKDQVKEWLKINDRDYSQHSVSSYIRERFEIEHHLSFCNALYNMEEYGNIERYNNRLIIIDEVHNVSPHKHKRKKKPNYDVIHKFLHAVVGCKIILLTATPMTDDSHRLYPLLNLMLPMDQQITSEHDLNSVMRGRISYHEAKVDAAKIYYVGTKFADVRYPLVISEMTGCQSLHYSILLRGNYKHDIFRHITHCSLFCFEDGTYGGDLVYKKLTEEVREVEVITYKGAKVRTRKIRHRNYRIKQEYVQEVCPLSALRDRSSKYYEIVKALEENREELSFVFIEEVEGSGLLLFSAILQEYDYSPYFGQNLDSLSHAKRFTVCVGNSSISPNTSKRIAGFNDDRNSKGQYVSVMLGSRVVGECITLRSVRHFHCAVPHWNESTLGQAMGRVVRSRSHSSLPDHERTVYMHVHASIYDRSPEKSIDIKKVLISQTKEDSIEVINKCLISLSIENIFSRPIDLSKADVTTFNRYYIDYHAEKYMSMICREIHRHCLPLKISDLCNVIRMPKHLVYEVLIRMISSNSPIDYYGSRCYLREWDGILTAVYDPTVCRVHYDVVTYMRVERQETAVIQRKCVQSIPKDLSLRDVLHMFYSLRWDDKVLFIERCIEEDNAEYCKLFVVSLVRVGEKIYHMYDYRRPFKGSYSVSSRGIKCAGLTRAFDGHSWSNVHGDEEKYVIDIYENNLREMEQSISVYGFYGVLSTVDGKIRVRDVVADDEESKDDFRRIHRGRNISTLTGKSLENYMYTLVNQVMKLPDREQIMRDLSHIQSTSLTKHPLSSVVVHLMHKCGILVVI